MKFSKRGGSENKRYPLDKSQPKSAETKKEKRPKINEKDSLQNGKVSKDWFWHSCLYGHKDNLKSIIERFPGLIKINETQVDGNTAIHFGIFGNHLTVLQILLGKFGNELELSIRNNDGLNPLDLAVVMKNNAIMKLLCKDTKPEMSSLIHAVKEIIYKLCVVASAWGPPNQAPNASKCVEICSLT